MKNNRVIYTGCYNIGWGPYNKLHEWQEISISLLKRYAKNVMPI